MRKTLLFYELAFIYGFWDMEQKHRRCYYGKRWGIISPWHSFYEQNSYSIMLLCFHHFVVFQLPHSEWKDTLQTETKFTWCQYLYLPTLLILVYKFSVVSPSRGPFPNSPPEEKYSVVIIVRLLFWGVLFSHRVESLKYECMKDIIEKRKSRSAKTPQGTDCKSDKTH